MKKLSIVIPTLNRSQLLGLTVEAFKPQLLTKRDNVELVICNNASDDDTLSVLEDLNKEKWFDVIDYHNRVDIGGSIYRSLTNAKGEYVVLWGDDDIPYPYYVNIILDFLNSHPDVSLIHYNRLLGDANDRGFSNLRLLQNKYPSFFSEFHSTDDFLRIYFLDTTFMSSVVFKKELWEASSCIDTKTHYGYEFYLPIMKGMVDKKIIYIHYPLCIQRITNIKNRTWSDYTAKCRLLGMPNLLSDMESMRVISDAKYVWNSSGNTFKHFLIAVLQAAGFKKIYKPLIKEINKYQYTFFRKMMVVMIVYFVPSGTYRFLNKWNKNNNL